MKLWNAFQSGTKEDLIKLLSSKTSKEWESNLEHLLEKASTNTTFLNSLTLILNTQSYSRLLFNNFLEKIWKNLQLPNKKDQEKTLYLMHELQFKIHQLEKELKMLRLQQHSGSGSRPVEKIPRKEASNISILKTKKSAAAENLV